MSGADVPPLLPDLRRAAGGTSGSRRDGTSARRLHSAHRWAAAVLTAATVALAGYLALLVAAVTVVGWFVEAVRPGAVGPLDPGPLVIESLPTLLIAWCGGMAATTFLARGEALGPRLAGVTGGAVGTAAGAFVLYLTGLLPA